MADYWDPTLYSQFLDLRTRPARDLLAIMPSDFNPKVIYDLGCGPGNSTILLQKRWPLARVIGVDSSENMLIRARDAYPTIEFVKADIADFSPPEKIDYLFANASLQWLQKHDALLPKLLDTIHVGGAFGFQMPNNFHCPTHQVTINLLKNNPAWHLFLSYLLHGEQLEPIYKPSWYYDVLTGAGVHSLQLWETEYAHEMLNYQGIFDWLKGTGLRPVLSKMDEENQNRFEEAFVKAIADEYPLQANNKVILPFRRVFMAGFKTHGPS